MIPRRIGWRIAFGRAAIALLCFGILLAAPPALAVSDPSEKLPDPVQERRAEALGAQLRCLVCQNESIEDSDAGLARDLRRILRARVRAGQSDAQIERWMVERYGGFIRLRPAFDATTLLLWTMPALALLAGIAAATFAARRARILPGPTPLSSEERERLDRLIAGPENTVRRP